MATRTAAKAAPRKNQAAPKRAAGTKTKAASAPRKRTAAQSPSVKKPAAKKAATPQTQAAKTPAAPRTKATASRRSPARGASKPRTSRAPKPKAMEVSYSGRIFRSRLEARWAIFLDLLSVNWDYEPSFYQVGEDLFYLPDFYLPDQRLWLEVKGAPFMDTASMAKCLGSVAGPMRIPLREAPYTASDRLLLGGPFRSMKHGLTPVHTLITPAGPNIAALSYAAFDIRSDGGVDIATRGPAWDTTAATGVKAARRPTPARLQLLLEPEPQLQGASIPDRITRAYQGAFRVGFDDQGRNISDHTLLASVAGRRSGRPLGVAA